MKTNLISLITILFIGVLYCSPLQAQKVSDLLRELNVLDRTADKTLDKTKNLLDDQQRALFLNLQYYSEYMLGRLKIQLKDLTRELKNSERAILSHVRLINNTLNNVSKSWQRKITDVTISIENSITRLPFTNRTPTPIWYDIPKITSNQNEIIKIRIKGIRLNSRRNFIIFNKKIYRISQNPSDRENIFTVPLTRQDVFDPHKKDHTFTVVLFKRKRRYTYKVPFVVLPQKIASVTFLYDLPYKAVERRGPYRGHQSATSGTNARKTRTKTFRLVNRAAESWIMDRASIRCRKSQGKSRMHRAFGPINITDISFQAGAQARRGKAVCECTWKEKRTVDRVIRKSKSVVVSFRNKYHHGRLPPKAILKSVVYKFYDGQESEAFLSPNGNHHSIEYRVFQGTYTVKFNQ